MSAAAGTNRARIGKRRIGRRRIGKAAALAGALAVSPIAQAQDSGSVSDYRLPDPKQTPTPRVQGPVDPDNPYSVPTSATQPQRTPAPAPSAQPSSAPRVILPAPQTSEPARERPAPRPTAAPTPRASSSPEPTPSPSTSASAVPTEAASSAPAPAVEPSSPATDNTPSATVAAPAESETNWLLPAGAAVVIAGAVAAFLLRRRRRSEEEPEVIEDAAPAPEPGPPPVPAIAPKAPTPPVAPPPASPGALPEPLDIAFAPQAIRLSLVYATLQYEMVVRNTGETATPPLQVRGDLSSAHASISTREQLAPSPELLEIKHEVAPLERGEAMTLKGEVRVPLQQIRPLVKGSASFLVPLARFVVLPADGAALRRVYTLGPRDPGSGAIASVRLDAGPRNLRDLDAREIEAARAFALDPEAAHS